MPAPTAYTDKVLTAFHGTQSKPTSLKRNPFNQTSARFVSTDYKARSAPGPGQYRIPGFADESLRKAVVEGGKKPPFNVASARRWNMTRKEEFNTPGEFEQVQSIDSCFDIYIQDRVVTMSKHLTSSRELNIRQRISFRPQFAKQWSK